MSENYKLLLVDDEDEVRGRIASQITNTTGFKIIGKSGNGYDALEIIEKEHPDVVLTDIRMPFIDGLELARIIRRDYPTTRVAFITGYDEFNYAKEAIELKVVKYLMKPVSTEEIKSFLEELKESLDKETKLKKNTLDVQSKYKTLIPLLGDSFLSSLLHGPRLTSEQLNTLELYDIPVKHYHNFCTSLVQLEDEETDTKNIQNIEKHNRLKVALSELFKKIFGSLKFKHTLLVSEGVVLLFSLDDLSKNTIDAFLYELKELMLYYHKVHIRIGVSSGFEDFKEFPLAFYESKKAVGYANRYNYNQIVYFDEIEDQNTNDLLLEVNDFILFDQLVQFGNKNVVSNKIDEFKNSIASKNVVLDITGFRLEIAHLIKYLASKAGVSLEKICSSDILTCIIKFRSEEEILEYLKTVLFFIHENDARKRITRNEAIVNQALEYIESHFEDPSLSLEVLSQVMNISISHLSMLLKKHTRNTFTSYLIQLRIEKAKELLTNTELRISDVASLCGYNDVYYFSHSFKKYTGISPRKYAKQ